MDNKIPFQLDLLAQAKNNWQKRANRIKIRRQKNETKVKCQIATAILERLHLETLSKNLDNAKAVEIFYDFVYDIFIAKSNPYNDDYASIFSNYLISQTDQNPNVPENKP